jgi:hypothetical protein
MKPTRHSGEGIGNWQDRRGTLEEATLAVVLLREPRLPGTVGKALGLGASRGPAADIESGNPAI